MEPARRPAAPVRLGVSSCLLGERVRFDGGHKRDAFVVERLGAHVEWVAVCPEVEMGLGTPRPSLRLVEVAGQERLVVPKTGDDHTDEMRAWAAARLDELAGEDLDGYVLKRSSPSCGMERVKVYSEAGQPARGGRGIFAAALVDRFPGLPVEEEGRLSDPVLRENFVERIFAYRRLKNCFRPGWRPRDLVDFHSDHKLTLLAHAPAAYRALGRRVAGAGTADRETLERDYRRDFMEAMAVRATTGRHVNVLEHMLGYFRDDLDADTRRDVHDTVDDYAAGVTPLIVPVTLIRHYVRRLGIEYLARQSYLDLHPRELMLRNHL